MLHLSRKISVCVIGSRVQFNNLDKEFLKILSIFNYFFLFSNLKTESKKRQGYGENKNNCFSFC